MKRPVGISGWTSVLAAGFMILAAVAALVAIPLIIQDPDATVVSASGSLLTVALMNGLMAFAVLKTGSMRPVLIIAAIIVGAMALFALDGAASMVNHPRAPGLLPPMFWVIVGCDAGATLMAIAAAIVAPKSGTSNRSQTS